MSIEYDCDPQEYERTHPAAFIVMGVVVVATLVASVFVLPDRSRHTKLPTVNATCVTEARYAT